jgi:hypothetical protein
VTKEVFFHLGLPKTATTTLQNRVFCSGDEYLYLGKHNPKYTPGARDIDEWLVKLKGELVSKELPYFSNYDLAGQLKSTFGGLFEENDKLLISEEGILSRCLGPQKYDDFIRIGSVFSVLQKIKALFNENHFKLRIVLVLRRQDHLLESFYAEDYQKYKEYLGLGNVSDFLDYFKNNFDGEIGAVLNYSYLVSYADKLFGEENVLVLPYEMLKDNPEMYLKEISGFMGVESWERLADKLKANKDNVRANENRKKLANTGEYPVLLARLKRVLFGSKQIDGWSFLKKFKLRKYVAFSELDRREILKKFTESNLTLKGRVKKIEDYDYF